ncbi:MAG: hypothetical protein ACOCYB_12065 [Alkalispirochaeta sp.]
MESVGEFFSLGYFIAAFGGGLFGAALGALPAFIFTGFLVIAGEMIAAMGETSAVTAQVAFGAVFGPHISFGGGVAAAAFAAKKGIVDAGRDILTPPTKGGVRSDFWQVLVVGGVFGVIGHLIRAIGEGVLALPTDNIALGVFLSALIVRVVFSPGKTGIFGQFDSSVASSRMSLPEDRHNAWLPFFSRIELLLLVGAGVGALSAWMSLLTGSVFIGFGISAASLIALNAIGPVPVTHHISLVGALGGLAVAEPLGATAGVIGGLVFGVIAALIGELGARLFISWGDTHVDPPAFAIFIGTSLVIGLSAVLPFMEHAL